MPDAPLILLGLVIFAALAFDFINGFHDTANAIATCISTRALSIRSAILMAAGLNFVGAFISTHVATTIGKGIVDPETSPRSWSWQRWRGRSSGTSSLGTTASPPPLPTRSSGADRGGGRGAGFHPLQWGGISKILIGIVVSPSRGRSSRSSSWSPFTGASGTITPRRSTARSGSCRSSPAAFMAFSHGSNDAQKSMGVISLALVSYGAMPVFHIPVWVIFACATAMALGTAMGGWRIIKTVGTDFVELEPVHGFCAETSSSAVILTATAMGVPISTTHVITSAILGVGLSQGRKKVNWKVGIRIIWAWILTIPASAAAGYFAFRVLSPFLVKL